MAASPTPSPLPAVITVQVISVQRAASILHGLYPRAAIRVDRASNSLIVVGPPDEVQAMRTLVQGIDVRNPTDPTVEVVQLHFIKPQQMLGSLHPLYPNARIEVASKSSLLIRAIPPDMAQIKALISSLDQAPPTVAPSNAPTDAVKVMMTNPRDIARAVERQLPHVRASVAGSTVVFVGSSDDIQKAKELAQTIDAPAFGAKYTQVYRLHNVDAQSVGDLVARSYPSAHVIVDKDLNAISVLATAAEHERIASAIAQLDAGVTGPGVVGGSQGGAVYGDSNFDVIDLDSAMPGQNGSPSTSATDIANAVTQLLSTMAPDLRISVPANSSQILLAGSPTSIKLAHDLIERLDRAQPLVVLDTEVLEVDENSAKNLGLLLPQAVLSTTFTEIQPTPNPNTGFPGRLGKIESITRTALQLTAALNLLIQEGNGRVLADPRITTISGHQATIRAGDTISILTQTSGGVGTPVTQQVQSFQTGVTLDITPQVSKTGAITVMLHPVVNSLEGLLNGVPQIATRDTQTVVQLQDNQTLVIGGLIQETSQRTINKIPVLGDIPLVGKVFQNNSVQRQRNELIIVVTPHILKPGSPAPPPSAVLPVPNPQALPTLPPGTTLPAITPPPTPSSTQHIPSPHPFPSPINVGPTLYTPVPSPSTLPQPTPTAFAQTNVFEYGSAPSNTFATESAAAQIFYARFSPTLLHSGSLVTAYVVTTTNVKRVTIGYQGYTTSLSQIAPSKWQGSYNFDASGLLPSTSPVNLTLSAYGADGSAATIQIPINLLPSGT